MGVFRKWATFVLLCSALIGATAINASAAKFRSDFVIKTAPTMGKRPASQLGAYFSSTKFTGYFSPRKHSMFTKVQTGSGIGYKFDNPTLAAGAAKELPPSGHLSKQQAINYAYNVGEDRRHTLRFVVGMTTAVAAVGTAIGLIATYAPPVSIPGDIADRF